MAEASSIFAEFDSLCSQFEKMQDKAQREATGYLIKNIERIYLQMSRLDVNSIGSISEAFNVIGVTCNNVDAIWINCPIYTPDRMINLLNSISNDISKFIARYLKKYNLFDMSKPSRTLPLCYKIVSLWIKNIKEATTVQWVQCQRPWKEGEYHHERIESIKERLEFFVDYRRSFISCVQYKSDYMTPDVQSFSSYLKASEEQFSTMKEALMDHLQSLISDSEVSDKLISTLRDLKDNQDGLADQLVTYSFLKNFKVFAGTYSEYEGVRDKLFATYLDLIHNQISQYKTDDPTDTMGIIWFLHQTQYIKDYMKKCPNADRTVTSLSKQVINDFEKTSNEMFEGWANHLLKEFKDIDFSSPLVEYKFDPNSKLAEIVFPTKYDTALSQSNSLSALKCRLPQSLQEAIRKIMEQKQAYSSIKQTCDFYNQTVLNIIKPLRRLMANYVDAFGATFQSITSVDFTQKESVNPYIGSILKAATDLSNNYDNIYGFHKKFIGMIAELFDCTLISQKDKWRLTMFDIREEIKRLYKSGYTNVGPWVKHLNAQIYKALDYQFENTLMNMESDVEKITITVDYKRPDLVFEPPVASLRVKLYEQIQDLINIPSDFLGITSGSGDSEKTKRFANITNGHIHAIQKLYKRTEELLKRVNNSSSYLETWLALGRIPDFDAEIAGLFKTPEEFRSNFNIITLRESEIDQIPDSVQLDFVTVNFVLVKGAFRKLVGEYKRSVCSLLRKSLDEDISFVMDFINTSLASIQTTVQSSDEVKRVKETINSVGKRIEEFKKPFAAIRSKSSLLMIHDQASRQSLQFQVDSIQSHWQIFQGTLNDQNKTVMQQMKTLRSLMSQKFDDFQRRTAAFRNRWEERKPKNVDFSNQAAVKKAIATVKETKQQLEEFKQEREMLAEEEAGYGASKKREFADLKEVAKQLKSFENTWLLVDKWQSDLDEISGEDWLTYRTRLYDLEDFLKQWEETVNSVAQSEVSDYVLDQVRDLLNAYPSFKYVRGENWVSEHWEELGIIIKYPKPMKINELKLGDILNNAEAIRTNEHQIKKLCDRAKGEGTIRSALREIREWNMHTEFVLFEQQGVPVIKEWKDLLTQVSDMQATIQSLSSLQFADAFESEIQLWTTKFTTLHEALLLLNQIQRKWLHLAPIFSSGALPSHTDKFNALDSQFKGIMNDIKKDPQVTSLLNKYDIVATLKGLMEGLDACQSALTAFLESKRQGFPRLYFIGDFDLLEILGKVRESPEVVQTHLKNLFQGISSVVFDDDNKLIAYCSSLGEKIYLPEPIFTTSSVEVWLSELCQKMQRSLVQLLTDYMDCNEFTTKNFPSQIVQVGEGIKYARAMTKAIPERQLNNLREKYTEFLRTVADFRNNPLHDPGVTSSVQMETTERSEVSLIKSLIIDLVQYTTVMEDLSYANVTSLDNFEWMRRYKYYYEDERCVVRMCDGTFDYGYEYQGNAPKLVHTPLTDLCWSTLCEGMHLGFAGNPYGPAGTGKTESVKALGQAMGRQVLVFNCGDGIDVKSICRIFTGLVQCGAWGCFDEFNRLDELVLSAVSQQIQAIQTAILKKRENVTLLNKTVPLDLKSGIFVTLNPAGKAYGGRSKLPNNLKALFRSVSMSQPDKALIGEIMLYSEGFRNSKELAQRLTTVFSLASQLLSKQRHYDWGLRAQKTVLNMAGQWLRDAGGSSDNEDNVIIKALLFDTLGKLDDKDRRLFLDIVKDIFKTEETDAASENALQQYIDQVIEQKKLLPSGPQLTKISLLNQLIQHRTGAVIVGPAGCGKSTVWKVLAEALTLSGRECHVWHIVPKADTLEMLMGSIDLDTREWTDGSLTKAARAASRLPPNEIGFIVCDGDVDPVWIESLNSVLDDNRLLTLPTGERIQFDTNVKFIFETHSLQFASPATVSRMGVLFVNRSDFDIKLTFPAFTEGMAPQFVETFNKIMPALLIQMQKISGHFVFQLSDLSIVRNIIPHIKDAETESEFVLGLARACAALVSPTSIQNKVADMVVKLSKKAGFNITVNSPLTAYYDKKSGTIKQYEFEKIPEGEWNVNMPPFVATPESCRSLAYAQKFAENNEPLLVVGPKGCGKTNLIQKLYKGDVEVIYCNALTNAKYIITRLSDLCSTSPGANGLRMKPRSGRPLTIFFKGVQYPSADKFDTVQLHSFIRQLTQLNGFMNDSLEWVELAGISIVASIDPSESLQPISERLISQFRIICIDYLSVDSLRNIYGEYLTSMLHSESQSEWNNSQVCYELAKSMINVYDQFLRTNNFTPKDLTRWVTGIRRYFDNNPSEVLLYEACRLFSDRLGGAKRKEFEQILMKNISGKLGVFASFGQGDSLLHRMGGGEIKKQLNAAVTGYERENGPLEVSLQSTTMKLATQINRALAMKGGHLMFVAVTGTGAKEVLRMTVYAMKGKVFTPAIFDGYSIRHFGNDLKQAISAAAFDKNVSIFCLEEYQLLQPSFFEYINSLLSGVFPPSLYTAEEIKALLSQLEDISFEEFKRLVFEHFRLVFIIDPRSPGYVPLMKSQPMLHEACTILNLGEFPEGVLNDMVPQILSKIEADPELAKLPFAKVAKALSIPTANFPSLVRAFVNLSKKKSESLANRKQFLSDGLLRLNAVSSRVTQLSKEADAQRVQVQEKEQRAKEAMSNISKTMTELTKQQDQMDVIQKELSIKEGELKTQKAEIDAQLADILPILQRASENVGKLDNKDISELKSFSMPPQQVRDVLEAVLYLLGERDVSWQAIRRVFGQPSIKDRIIRFDPHQVTPKNIDAVNKHMKDRPSSFIYEDVARVSKAAAPLSQWVRAMSQYCVVLREVSPLEEKMKRCDDELTSSRKQLEALEEKKIELNNQVNVMQEQFQNYTAEAEKLRISLNEIEEKQSAASNLLSKLSDEQTRWAKQVKEIEAENDTITPRLLMASAFITEAGKMNESERSKMMKNLAEVLELKEPFNFTNFMNTQSEILEMKHDGFPSDDLSVENAQIIQNTEDRTLFVIDPTEKVVGWLQAVLGPSAETLSSSHPRFQHQVTLAIRFGKKLIIREADKIPLCLFPYLSREFVMSNGHLTVSVGDKFIDVHPDFRLIVVTRDASIKLTPRENSLVSLVNFTVTKTALKAQLLSLALSTELPELEQKHQEQLAESEELKIELGKLEEGLLDILAKADPNTILSNKELIKSLDEKKKRAVEVESRLADVARFQAKIQEKRGQYQMLADISSSIFFTIDTLYLVHPMYRFSINEFTSLFKECFANCNEKENRVKKLVMTFNSMAYSHFSRALFREHRLVYGLSLLKTVYPKMFPEAEYHHLLHQKPATPQGLPSYIPADRQQSLASLAAEFPELYDKLKFADYQNEWQQWLDCGAPELASSWPQIDGKSVPDLGASQLQRILILQALRPDRVLAALEKLVISTFKNPRVLSLREVMNGPDQSIVFIVTPGSDPSMELKEIALEIESVGEQNYIELALGECDSSDALSIVRQAARAGQWAVIKNVHLDIDFLQQLEKLLPSLGAKETFKLVLTTEATSSFPTVLLQSSAKIAYEAPPGLINQMKRTLTLWNDDWFNSQTKKVRQNLVSLAHLHGILQERRAFLPVGWSQYFEFTQADLNAASQIIVQRCDATDVVCGLINTTVYGSRMDSEYDRRVLNGFVRQAFPASRTNLFDIPSDPSLDKVQALLQQCQMEDGPGLLSLCANANATIARSTLITSFRFLSLLSAAGKEAGASGRSHAQHVQQLAQQFPGTGDEVQVVLANHPALDFLVIQRSTAHKLVRMVMDDLDALSSAVDASLLPARLRAVSAALKTNAVPGEWATDWIDTEAADEWLDELFARTGAVDAVATRLRDHQVLTTQPVPLYASVRPSAFMSALLQTAARMNRTELDDMKLAATFDRPAQGALLSINVCDITAQACVVDHGAVAVSEAPNNDLAKLERVFISVVRKDTTIAQDSLVLPIFEGLTHERIVCDVTVPCTQDKDALILSSACLVLNH